MIERVAKALCLSGGGNPYERREVGDDTFWEWELRVPQARAAIQAMMGPTDAMAEAGWDAMPNAKFSDHPEEPWKYVMDAYRAMLNAAIGDSSVCSSKEEG